MGMVLKPKAYYQLWVFGEQFHTLEPELCPLKKEKILPQMCRAAMMIRKNKSLSDCEHNKREKELTFQVNEQLFLGS